MIGGKLYYYANSSIIWRVKMSNENLEKELSGPEFVQLMEKYGIKPSELGIKSNYKNMLKHGKRKPSKQLIIKLMSLIQKIEGKETMTPGGGLEPPTTGYLSSGGLEPPTS